MKIPLLLSLLIVALSLTACDDFGQRVTFDVSLVGSTLHVCADFDLGPTEAATMSEALTDTFGAKSGKVITTTDKIWNAKSVQDLADVIRRSKR